MPYEYSQETMDKLLDYGRQLRGIKPPLKQVTPDTAQAAKDLGHRRPAFQNPLHITPKKSDPDRGVFYSDNFNPLETGRRTIQSTPQIDEQAKSLTQFNTPRGVERERIFVHQDNGFVELPSDGGIPNLETGHLETTGNMKIDRSKTNASAHTHPRHKDYSIVPGKGDMRETERGTPFYVVRGQQVIAVEIDNGQYSWRPVAGNFSSRDVRSIQDRINFFQAQKGEVPE